MKTRARWDEIDFKRKVWVIPADKMKAGKTRAIPLRTDKAYVKEYTPEASSDIYFGSSGENSQGWLDWNNNNRHDRNAYFRFNNGTSVGSPTWFQKFYTRTTNTTTLEYQDPAKILIGGTLSFLGENNERFFTITNWTKITIR